MCLHQPYREKALCQHTQDVGYSNGGQSSQLLPIIDTSSACLSHIYNNLLCLIFLFPYMSSSFYFLLGPFHEMFQAFFFKGAIEIEIVTHRNNTSSRDSHYNYARSAKQGGIRIKFLKRNHKRHYCSLVCGFFRFHQSKWHSLCKSLLMAYMNICYFCFRI